MQAFALYHIIINLSRIVVGAMGAMGAMGEMGGSRPLRYGAGQTTKNVD